MFLSSLKTVDCTMYRLTANCSVTPKPYSPICFSVVTFRQNLNKIKTHKHPGRVEYGAPLWVQIWLYDICDATVLNTICHIGPRYKVPSHLMCWVSLFLCIQSSLSKYRYVWTSACFSISLQWRHNEHDGVSNHQPQDCLLNRLIKASASLAFVREIHRRPVNSPHKGPVTRKMFPFDDVIMCSHRVSVAWFTISSFLVCLATGMTLM